MINDIYVVTSSCTLNTISSMLLKKWLKIIFEIKYSQQNNFISQYIYLLCLEALRIVKYSHKLNFKKRTLYNIQKSHNITHRVHILAKYVIQYNYSLNFHFLYRSYEHFLQMWYFVGFIANWKQGLNIYVVFVLIFVEKRADRSVYIVL